MCDQKIIRIYIFFQVKKYNDILNFKNKIERR